MATESSTPNFYILLGLNPDERWDETKFQAVKHNKQIEWSRQANSIGKRALAAQSNLKLLPEIERVMIDATLREAQAQAARAELAAGHKDLLEEFEKDLKYVNAKDTITQAELDAFIKKYQVAVAANEIKQRITAKVVANTNTTEATTMQAQQLEPSTFKAINDNLELLHLSTLYELLEMSSRTAGEELKRAAEALYAEMSKRPAEPIVTAKKELAGQAKTIFQSDTRRKQYDESLRQRSLNALLKELEERINRTPDKEVHAKQVMLFLDEASKVGWSQEVALARLKEQARQRKWIVTVPTLDSRTQERQRCGNCNALNEKGRNFCHQCNRELALNCPNCGQRVLADEIACGNCSFPVGNRFWVDTLIERISMARGPEQAEELLNEAEMAWRKPSRPDVRAQRLMQLRATVQQQRQQKQALVQQLNDLIGQRNYYAARQFLLMHSDVADTRQYSSLIETPIAQAQELLRRAQARTLKREERVDLCRQALRLCADYKEARELLSTMPPESASRLRTKAGKAMVSLQWEASPTAEASYRIVRKSNTAPVSAQDGVVLATVAGCSFDDTKPDIGLPLYYAVYAECEGIFSTQGVVASTPILLLGEIQLTRQEVDHQHVSLTWQLPPHAHTVIVVRKEHNRPNGPSDGQRISLISMTQMVDSAVQTNCSYYYGIYCQFQDAQGRVVTSDGKIVEAIPETPPQIVMQLAVTSTKTVQGYRVTLKWTKPDKGKLIVLKSREPLVYKAGESLPFEQLKGYESALEGSAESVNDEWKQTGIGYYTAVVVFRETAYVGVMQRFACIDDVSQLHYEMLGHALRLRWQWPTGCKEAVVAYRYDRWPEPQEVGSISQRVTYAEYSSQGCFDIRGIAESDYYIVVAAMVRQGNELVVGNGERVQARLASKITLKYEIKLASMWRKRRTLHLYTSKPGVLPTLLLVTRRDRLPFNKSEGQPFFECAGPLAIEQELVFELPENSFPAKTFAKLYLADDAAYEIVSINHPGMDKLRLG